jgi:hypothetical protein
LAVLSSRRASPLNPYPAFVQLSGAGKVWPYRLSHYWLLCRSARASSAPATALLLPKRCSPIGHAQVTYGCGGISQRHSPIPHSRFPP